MKSRWLAIFVMLGLGGCFCGCKAAGDPVVVQGALDEAAYLGSEAKCPGQRTARNLERTTAHVASLQALIRILGAPR